MDFLIYKICTCCSNEQLTLFEQYLTAKNQLLSQKLIHHIKNTPNKSLNYYCEAVYGNTSKENLKKFNQLNHHTLNYFSFLSQHFPSFIAHNLQKVEWLIYHDKTDAAIENTKLIIEVAKKFEDYSTLIQLYELIPQNKLLAKTVGKQLNVALHSEFSSYFNTIRILIERQETLTSTSVIEAQKKINPNDLQFFKTHFNSPSLSIRIISRQAYLNLLSSYNHTTFYDKKKLSLIEINRV